MTMLQDEGLQQADGGQAPVLYELDSVTALPYLGGLQPAPEPAPRRYRVFEIAMDRAQQQVRIDVTGNYALFWTDGILTGVVVQIDDPRAGRVPIESFNPLRYDEGAFNHIYLTFTAQAGRTLRIFVGLQMSVGKEPTLSPVVSRSVLPVARAGRYSGTATTYQTVVSYTVSTGRVGNLGGLSAITNQVTLTQYRLIVGGVVQWEDRIFQGSLSVAWPDNSLDEGAVVLLEARSTDGTSITVDGIVTGTEK